MAQHHTSILRAFLSAAICAAAIALARAAGDAPQIPVIVEINLPAGSFTPEARLSDATAVLTQRRAIAAATERILSKLARGKRARHRFQTIPYLALDLSAAELTALANSSSDIVRVLDDAIVRPVLADSVPLIEGDQAWDAGYDGSGTMIAVLDTGVDRNHPF